jgi:hypothetical protein
MPCFFPAKQMCRPSLATSLVTVFVTASMLLGGETRAQPPVTNYENSGVVSEMIGSNAAGITAYTTDFVARFTSERVNARVQAAVERLKNQRRLSWPDSSHHPTVERVVSQLGFMLGQSEIKNTERDAQRAREALKRSGIEHTRVQALISSLHGLLAGQRVDATGFVEAIEAYNRIVEAETDSVLANPPQELLSIHAVLTTLTDAVTPEHKVVPSMARTSGRAPTTPELLPLLPPDSLDGVEKRAPLVKPGTATATPTAFGAAWGQVYGAIGLQPVSRYATVSETDWRKGEWSDGTISLGAGLGNPHRWVGLDVTLNIFDTRSRLFGGSDQFGKMRTLSLKLHRALPHESAVAVGYENAWRNSPEEGQGGNSLYGVVSKTFAIRAHRNSLFSRATVSVGLGNDRFLPESQYQRQAQGVNVFGNIGVRLCSFMNIVADWTGQDLNVGVSVTPVPRVPLVLTPALVDVTGRAGDQVRFSIGAAMAYDFRR